MDNYNGDLKKQNRISLIGMLFAVSVALTPAHQALLTSSGSTINKYLAFAIIVLMVGQLTLNRKPLIVKKGLYNTLFPFALWIVFSLLWSMSRSNTISGLTTISAHIVLLLLCCDYPWTEREKKLIRYALIITSAYFACTLIGEMVSGEVKRATLSFGMQDAESDQNILAVNIGISAIIAFDNMYKAKEQWVKVLNIAAIVVILFGILSTGSRGGLIAASIGLLYLLFKYYPGLSIQRALFLLSIAVFVVYFYSENSIFSEYIVSRFQTGSAEGDSGRTEIALAYMNAFFHKPWVWLSGSGFGTEGKLYGQFFQTSYPPATHNDYVTLLVSTGIIGFSLFYRFIRYVWGETYRDNQPNFLARACIISALIAAISVNTYTRYGFWNVLIFTLISL